MDANARLAHLRALLHEPPSARGWRRLCHTLEDWPVADPSHRVAIDYAAHHLEGWPKEVRRAPLRWEPGRHGAWGLVRSVDLSGCRLGDEGVQRLLSSGGLRGVQVLDLSDNDLSALAAAALATSPDLGDLRVLRLARNRIETRGTVTLSRPRSLDALELLDLTANAVGPDGVSALMSGPIGASLVNLILSNNPVGVSGMRALTDREVPRLEALELCRCHLGTVGLHTLLTGLDRLPSLRALRFAEADASQADLSSLPVDVLAERLQSLDLSALPLTAADLRALFGPRPWLALTELRLASCRLDQSVGRVLAEASLPRLSVLDLSYNDLAGSGAAIARARWAHQVAALDLSASGLVGPSAPCLDDFPALRRLSLRMAGLDEPALRRWLAQGAPTHLTSLDLSNNLLGPDAMTTLVASGLRPTELRLGTNAIGGEGLATLLRTPTLGGLETLDVSANQIPGQVFEGSIDLAALATLDVSYNRVGNRGMKALARQHLPALASITARFNRITATDEDPFWTGFGQIPLEKLDLGDNVAGDEGVRRIARCPNLQNLHTLTLRNVGMTDHGLRRLLDGDGLPSLEALDVSHNDVSLRGMRRIATRRGTRRLDRVDLQGNQVLSALVARITRFRSWHMAVGVRL